MSAIKYNVGDIVIFYNSGFLTDNDRINDCLIEDVQAIGDHKFVKITYVDYEDVYNPYHVEYCKGNNVYKHRWVSAEYLMDIPCFDGSFDDSEEIILRGVL